MLTKVTLIINKMVKNYMRLSTLHAFVTNNNGKKCLQLPIYNYVPWFLFPVVIKVRRDCHYMLPHQKYHQTPNINLLENYYKMDEQIRSINSLPIY